MTTPVFFLPGSLCADQLRDIDQPSQVADLTLPLRPWRWRNGQDTLSTIDQPARLAGAIESWLQICKNHQSRRGKCYEYNKP